MADFSGKLVGSKYTCPIDPMGIWLKFAPVGMEEWKFVFVGVSGRFHFLFVVMFAAFVASYFLHSGWKAKRDLGPRLHASKFTSHSYEKCFGSQRHSPIFWSNYSDRKHDLSSAICGSQGREMGPPISGNSRFVDKMFLNWTGSFVLLFLKPTYK